MRLWVTVAFAAIGAFALAPVESAQLPDSYVLRAQRGLELCRADVPKMQPAAQTCAARLAAGAGGRLMCGGDGAVPSELTGRAGGMMLTLEMVGDVKPTAKDVVFYYPVDNKPIPQPVIDSGAVLVVFGRRLENPGPFAFFMPNHAEEAGISTRLANTNISWVFSAEVLAAITRLGKMPVLFESIGQYGGVPRSNQYRDKGIFWHATHTVRPIAAGVLGNKYINTISAILSRVEKEDRAKLNRAGAWAAQAKRANKRLFMYIMGHMIPFEIPQSPIAKLFKVDQWNSGFSYYKPPSDTYAAGDVLIHIGYQHPPLIMLQRAKAAKAKVVYVDILQNRDYVNSRDVIWIDPMWPWADACVPIPGYDIDALPASGIVNDAIAWEIYRLTQKNLARP